MEAARLQARLFLLLIAGKAAFFDGRHVPRPRRVVVGPHA